MSDPSNSRLANDIRERVKDLVSREFAVHPVSAVAQALEDLAAQLRRAEAALIAARSGQEADASASQQAWGQRVDAADLLALPARFAGYGADHTPWVEVLVETDEHAQSLVHQVLEVGVFLLDLAERPALQTLLSLRVRSANYNLDIETRARVVHHSGRHTAVEAPNLMGPERAALESLKLDLERRRHSLPKAQPAPWHPPGDGASAASGAAEADAGQRESLPAPGQPPAAHQGQRTQEAEEPAPGPDLVAAGWNPPPAAPAAKAGAAVANPGAQPGADARPAPWSKSPQRHAPAVRKPQGPWSPWLQVEGHTPRPQNFGPGQIMDVLLKLAAHSFRGVLEIAAEQVSRQYFFEAGCVVSVSRRPHSAAEELVPMLQSADRINESQMYAVIAHANRHQMVTEESVVELGFMDVASVRQAIAGRLRYLIQDLCNTASGSFSVYEDELVPDHVWPPERLRMHVGVEKVIFDQLLKHYSAMSGTERELQMSGDLESYPVMDQADIARMERTLGSEASHGILLKALSGRNRLREVFTRSPATQAETFSVVYALRRMNLVHFNRHAGEDTLRERYREEVRVKFLSVHKASYFEVLNIHWSSYDEVVLRACERVMAQFDTQTMPEGLEDEVYTRVIQIRERVQTAFDVLAQREQRHGYRMRIMPEYKISHAIPLFLKQAALAERRGQFDDARDALMRILELEPDNIDAWRSLYRMGTPVEMASDQYDGAGN